MILLIFIDLFEINIFIYMIYDKQEVMQMIYKGRAQCIVVRDGKILMVKHEHENYWCYCLPGGGIEHGETPEQAALRELQEE